MIMIPCSPWMWLHSSVSVVMVPDLAAIVTSYALVSLDSGQTEAETQALESLSHQMDSSVIKRQQLVQLINFTISQLQQALDRNNTGMVSRSAYTHKLFGVNFSICV